MSLTDRVHGRELAETLQLLIEYDPEPPFAAGSPETAAAGTLRLARNGVPHRWLDTDADPIGRMLADRGAGVDQAVAMLTDGSRLVAPADFVDPVPEPLHVRPQDGDAADPTARRRGEPAGARTAEGDGRDTARHVRCTNAVSR